MTENTKGFTLIEVVVAVFILSIGMLGVIGATAKMTEVRGQGDRASTASFYAQQRLERIRMLNCATMSSGSETVHQVYSLVWNVTAPAADRRHVQLAIHYPKSDGSTRVDTLETAVPC